MCLARSLKAFLLLSLALAAAAAPAADWPSRPIRVVTPALPGGTTDVLSRLFSARMTETLGTQVIVDNRGSASGVLGAEIVKADHIPYKGAGPSFIALMGGEYHYNFGGLAGALPLARAGKLRAIAVTTEKRIPGYEDIPTVKESGLPDFVVVGWYGVLTPPKLSKALVTRLHAELVKVLNEPVTNKRVVDLGGTPVGNDPETFRKFMLADMNKWADVVKKSGAKAE